MSCCPESLDNRPGVLYGDGMSTDTDTDTDTRPRWVQSSTGMLHVYGCGVFRPYRSRIRILTEDAAATVPVRCLHCRPAPNGTWVPQDDRPDPATVAVAAHAERAAAAAEAAAAWDAAQSDELDAAVRRFAAADARYNDDPAAAQAAWDAVKALAPDGYNVNRRIRELGL